MTSEEVAQLVVNALDGDWNRSNAHGIDFRRCLVQPHKRIFSNPLDASQQEELWIVLEEDPDNCSGYQIVFDEKSKSYGLATTDVKTNSRILLGFYGDFLNTVDSM